MSLTDDQVDDAIEQMVSHCRHSMELYKQGAGEYESLSARGVLYTLGFFEDEADQILRVIADRGFDYCLDAWIKSSWYDSTAQTMRTEYPDRSVCYWGADQLLSRLESIKKHSRRV